MTFIKKTTTVSSAKSNDTNLVIFTMVSITASCYHMNLVQLSVQFSCSVMSDSLWTHEMQHTRLPCPSPIPGVCSNSCPSSRWYHPTILSSVILFSSCLQSFPASGSFPMSQFFASGAQNIGVQLQSFQWILRVDSV